MADVAIVNQVDATPVELNDPEPSAPSGNVPVKETDKPSVDLKVWARTSAENRAYKTQLAELQAKVTELSNANPDQEKALQAKLIDILKQPGTAKRLITDGGRKFDDIVAELTDIPIEDPVLTEQAKRIEALELERKAEKEANDKAKQEQQARTDVEAVEKGRAEVLAFAKKDETSVLDEKDKRFGTPRWAIVTERPDLIEQARAAVVNKIAQRAKAEKDTSNEQVELLVSQALDQLELAERTKLAPLLTKLAPKRPVTSKDNGPEKRFTRTENPFASPTTITSDLKGPMPTKQPNKGRYTSGPRSIRYTD